MGFLNRFRKKETEYTDLEGLKEKQEENRILALHKEKQQKLRRETAIKRKEKVEAFVNGVQNSINTIQKGYTKLSRPKKVRRVKTKRIKRAKPQIVVIRQDPFGTNYIKPKTRARRKPKENNFDFGLGTGLDFFGSKKSKKFRYF